MQVLKGWRERSTAPFSWDPWLVIRGRVEEWPWVLLLVSVLENKSDTLEILLVKKPIPGNKIRKR